MAVTVPPPLRLAVFDCDGTLVDSQHSIVAAMRAACAAQELAEPSAEKIRRVVGLHLLEAIRALLPTESDGTIERVHADYIAVFRDLRARDLVQDPLYPGAREAIECLNVTGWLLGVATGKSHRGLMATLERHVLADRFATLQTADRAAGKPHPEMLHKAMAETGADPSATVMIGDTTFDMTMARAARTRAVGVAWGYHHADELRAAGADCIVSRFAELPAALAALMGEAT
ncbi:MAG: HAD-IA family hydrolase [Rhodospirillales bacterium]|nr:HAD-IA family hydrolase [Rhodospirillales bacterium]